MSLPRFVPIGFGEDEHDLWQSFASDVQRMDQQMKRMTDHFNSIVPAFPNMPAIDVRSSEAFRMDNPIMTDKDGSRKFHLEFDLRQFSPDEITLTTENNVLSVHAMHKEESEGRMSFREYRREYTLPDGVNVECLKSKLNHNGVLGIEAPVREKHDVMIPISHK